MSNRRCNTVVIAKSSDDVTSQSHAFVQLLRKTGVELESESNCNRVAVESQSNIGSRIIVATTLEYSRADNYRRSLTIWTRSRGSQKRRPPVERESEWRGRCRPANDRLPTGRRNLDGQRLVLIRTDRRSVGRSVSQSCLEGTAAAAAAARLISVTDERSDALRSASELRVLAHLWRCCCILASLLI